MYFGLSKVIWQFRPKIEINDTFRDLSRHRGKNHNEVMNSHVTTCKILMFSKHLRTLPPNLRSPGICRNRGLYLFQVPSDIEIARAQDPKDISQLAEEIGLHSCEFSCYGKTKAKISTEVLDRLKHVKDGKYIVVAG